MNSTTHLLVACLFAGALIAQSAARPVPLMVRQHEVASQTLRQGVGLGLRGHVTESVWLGAHNYKIDGRTVDLARREVLEVSREYVRLCSLDKRELWLVDRADVRVQGVSRSVHAFLFPSRIVLSRAGGGLVALDRATGAVAWEQSDAPSEVFACDDELVFVAGGKKKTHRLAAFSWRNGARAFEVPLAHRATRIIPGGYGVAVLHESRLVVHDRSGPQLFAVDRPAHDVIPVPQSVALEGRNQQRRVAWYARIGGSVHAWSSMGKDLWSEPMVHNDDECLCVTTAGNLVVAEFCNFSDSGFTATCFDRDNGGRLWRRREPGLAVDHSKYRHRLYVRAQGDRLLFVSQASGGDFGVALNPSDGQRLDREEWGR